jgi:SAM-dependent methyltransferase
METESASSPAPRRPWESWGDEQFVRTLDKQWNNWRVARNRRRLVRRLAAIKRQYPELQTLLDFGCGTCTYYPSVRRLGLEYRGADRTPQMLARAREKFPEVEIYEDDLLCSTTADRSFDIVICNDVLVHLPDPLPALRTLNRIARRWVLLKLCLTTKRLPDWLERYFPPPLTFERRQQRGMIRQFYNLGDLRSLIELELSPRHVRIDTFLPISSPFYWPGVLPTWEAIVSIKKDAGCRVREPLR